MSIKLIIPTRNRPRQLADLLEYLTTFYPDTVVVVADGSFEELRPQVKDVCARAADKLAVDFCAYPADLPLFDRMLDCIEAQDDEYLALCADDDYPVLETHFKALQLLRGKPDFSTVNAFAAVLKINHDESFSARFSVARPILQETAAERMLFFARWRTPTSYGVTRRSALVSRYRFLSRMYCAGFIDYQIGIEDCFEGKIGVVDGVGLIRTHSYKGSYLRPDDPLVFLRNSETVLAIMEHSSRRIQEIDQLPAEEAQTMAQKAMVAEIASLVRGGAKQKASFATSRLFAVPEVQRQYRTFYDLFDGDTETHRVHFKKLVFVRDRLLAQSRELPSEGKGNYETL